MHAADIDALIPLLVVLDLIVLSLCLPFELSVLPLKVSQLLLDLLSLLFPLRKSLIERRVFLSQPLYLIFLVLDFSLQLFLVSISFGVVVVELLLESSVLDGLIDEVFGGIREKLC